jgi:hypothetical protein
MALFALTAPATSLAWPPVAAAQHGSGAHERMTQRQALLRALRRDPRVVTRRWFVRKASLFGVDVPVTFRLVPQTGSTIAGAPDDSMRFDLDPSTTESPFPSGTAVPSASTTLTGSIRGSMRFSQDTAGYGSTGVVELGFSAIQMRGTGFDLIDAANPAPCGTDPALFRTLGPIRIGQSLTSPSRGYVDLFKQQFSLALHTTFSFASQTRADCTLDGNGDPPPYTTTSTLPLNAGTPLPLRLDGTFRISPALTSDGYMRFGKLDITGTPQHDSFVQLHSCTAAPPPDNACADNTEGVLTGRLVATAFSAEMLVGGSA